MATQQQGIEPRLWVEHLCLYSHIEPVIPIRHIRLRRGVNIVWAHEPDNAQSVPSVRAMGHGVGKTSFCLLLRYCLGDKTQSVRALCDEAAAEFPEGGVGATIHLDGQVFSVFRYFSRRKGFTAETADLDSLFSLEERTPYSVFERLLSEKMLSRLKPDSIPETGQKPEWNHLLAWLARDQGTRFARFFHWRQGEGTGLQRARLDPPVLMRAALGMLEIEEADLQRDVDRLERRIEDARQRITELEREPAIILRRIESELRAWLNIPSDIPMVSDDLLKDAVDTVLKDRLSQLDNTISSLQARLNDEDERLAGLREQLKREEHNREFADLDLQRQEALRTGDEKRLEEIAVKRSKLVQLIGNCEYGEVAFSECTHIAQRLTAHDFQDARDRKNLEQNLSSRAKHSVEAKRRLNQAKEAEAAVRSDYETARRSCQKLRMKLDTARQERAHGKRLWNERDRWLRYDESEDTELASEKRHLEDSINKLDSTKLKLKQFQQNQTSKEKHLSELTQDFAQRLLSSEVFARFVSRDDARPFQLSMKGGEAYRVLEILLGDAVCMQLAATTNEALPAFFLHDCPREADMSIHLYSNYLLNLVEMEKQLSGMASDAPFQYIATTTSPPPEELRKSPFLVLELKPGTEDSVLFRKQFGVVQEDWLR